MVIENNKEYIKQDNTIILNEGQKVHHGRVKFHNTGDWYDPFDYSNYDEDYFIIKFEKK
ncbi:hypothetical protein [Chryseobacterium ginsenosidimutans]|uniref:hypothetical protein n=1 Tax=Chryseobacterium ginsenosidimutans TaxID=687846 RepID=UPI0031D2F0D2